MKPALAALAFCLAAFPAGAQQYAAANGYRTCPQAQTLQGIEVVREACGTLSPPSFAGVTFSSLGELQRGAAARDAFHAAVADYGACVTRFINSYQRPGADANSTAPDQAACAHSWAEDQVVQTVRDYGRACVDFSNRSVMDAAITPWSGACYPEPDATTG